MKTESVIFVNYTFPSLIRNFLLSFNFKCFQEMKFSSNKSILLKLILSYKCLYFQRVLTEYDGWLIDAFVSLKLQICSKINFLIMLNIMIKFNIWICRTNPHHPKAFMLIMMTYFSVKNR